MSSSHAHPDVTPGAGVHGGAEEPSGLSELENSVLAFERRWWKYGGAKDHAIREQFEMSATNYFQLLNSLLDNPQALAADPMLIKRLRRIRDTRQRERSAARIAR